MEKSESKWFICRVCLQIPNDEMRKIFVENSYLAKEICECGGIQLYNSKVLPDSICSQCLILLRVAHKFRNLCQKSNDKLMQLFRLSKESKESKNNTMMKNNVQQDNEEDSHKEKRIIGDLEYILESVENSNMDVGASMEMLDEDESTTALTDLGDDTIVANDIEYLDDSEEDVLPTEETNTQLHLETSVANDLQTEYFVPSELRSKHRKQNCKVKIGHSGTSPSGAKPVCTYCGNIYLERSKLTLHMKTHTKDKPHECEICHKRFAQTPQLSRHMNSHTGIRPYKCKFCPSSFADPSTCIKHQRIHTNERPYNCEWCNKSFSYSNVLKVHMMTHTGEKPFHCEYCEKTFTQLHHKKAHERTHIVQS